jgi:hypothetical protein
MVISLQHRTPPSTPWIGDYDMEFVRIAPVGNIAEFTAHPLLRDVMPGDEYRMRVWTPADSAITTERTKLLILWY